MEDGPLKPDAAPVRKALGLLGVASAWMVGDTPDDIVAARGAGVVPIGFIPPGGESADTTESLERAGAARVLDSWNTLPEMLP
jgi:phosphoglycolate phosphatase-like HAD superfamily hydrolase